MLCARRRPADIDVSAGSVAELQRIVAQIRRRWSDTRILVRGDAGFCREATLARVPGVDGDQPRCLVLEHGVKPAPAGRQDDAVQAGFRPDVLTGRVHGALRRCGHGARLQIL
ncbi:MAG: transposase [Alphaproteobacteria bacterium]|nr:transposase [Alphaproteobacteria bacterium]